MSDNTYDNGDQLELNCSSEGGPDLVYSWRRNNDFSNETVTNTNTLTISDLVTVDGGDYTCTVTNDAGSNNTTVTVYGESSRHLVFSRYVNTQSLQQAAGGMSFVSRN